MIIFKAFARKQDSKSRFVTTEIKAKSLKNAKKWFYDNNYELDSKVYKA